MPAVLWGTSAPFLAPLYAFVAVHAPAANRVRPLPVYALLVLKHLAERWRQAGMAPCAETPRAWAGAPRVDASAAGDRVGIGGWQPKIRPDGTVDRGASPWFAAAITLADLPWAFEKQGEAYRLICSLALLAVLVAFRAFGPQRQAGVEHVVDVCPALTDSRARSIPCHAC